MARMARHWAEARNIEGTTACPTRRFRPSIGGGKQLRELQVCVAKKVFTPWVSVCFAESHVYFPVSAHFVLFLVCMSLGSGAGRWLATTVFVCGEVQVKCQTTKGNALHGEEVLSQRVSLLRVPYGS